MVVDVIHKIGHAGYPYAEDQMAIGFTEVLLLLVG